MTAIPMTIIVELGEDFNHVAAYLEPVISIRTLEQAKQAVGRLGYAVIDHGDGGCCEVGEYQDMPCFTVTVKPMEVRT